MLPLILKPQHSATLGAEPEAAGGRQVGTDQSGKVAWTLLIVPSLQHPSCCFCYSTRNFLKKPLLYYPQATG